MGKQSERSRQKKSKNRGIQTQAGVGGIDVTNQNNGVNHHAVVTHFAAGVVGGSFRQVSSAVGLGLLVL
jgi:hypothetical protein